MLDLILPIKFMGVSKTIISIGQTTLNGWSLTSTNDETAESAE